MLFFQALLSFIIVCASIPAAIRLAHKGGFVDRPGGRKQHDEAVPPVGGLVVFPAFMIVSCGGGALPAGTGWYFAALSLLLLLGAIDDRINVPAKIKFLCQFVAAFLIVVPGGAVVTGLGNLLGFGALWLGWGGIVFSMIATVLLINALNLMDGLDGLAGGIGLSALVLLTGCGFFKFGMAYDDLRLLAVFCAALAGFLVYNMRHPWRKRASVFMGDAGSLALGLTLAWFCMRGAQLPEPYAVRPVVVAWLLALPIFDTCGQFARRVARGRHPFDADHHHFHHHFLYAGFTAGRAVAMILLLSLALGLAGIAGYQAGIPEYVLAWLWTALLLAHIYMSLRPHRFRRILSRFSGKRAAAT